VYGKVGSFMMAWPDSGPTGLSRLADQLRNMERISVVLSVCSIVTTMAWRGRSARCTAVFASYHINQARKCFWAWSGFVEIQPNIWSLLSRYCKRCCAPRSALPRGWTLSAIASDRHCMTWGLTVNQITQAASVQQFTHIMILEFDSESRRYLPLSLTATDCYSWGHDHH
jgi:hypothetical protein